jgi:signal transduction histidine kinase/CheY-like chemotaxis protein
MTKILKDKYLFISFSVFILLILICILLFETFRSNLRTDLHQQLELNGQIAADDFERAVFNQILSLENMRSRIQESEGAFFEYFDNESKRILNQNPGIQFIEWINSEGVITRVSPLTGNENALNLDISKLDYRYPDWVSYAKDTLTNISPLTKLVQGGSYFLVDAPVYYDGKFQGTVTGGIDFSNQFDKLAENLENYAISIEDDRGNEFYTYNQQAANTDSEEFAYSSMLLIDPNNRDNWTFNFAYHNEDIYPEKTILQRVALVFGILLSLLVSITVYFYLTAKRETRRYVIANRDLHNLNIDLNREKKNALKASEAKTQFLSNMSHEIRTPLSAIIGFIEMLEGKQLQEEEQEYIKLMRHSSKTLLGLVNNIIEIDKIESGSVDLSEDSFCPKNSIKNIVDMYAPELQLKNLRKELVFETEQENTVCGDLSKFEQIFTNLLANAIKFTSNGFVRIRYRELVIDNFLQIDYSVEDSGIGIPKSKLPTVFNRFTQVDDVIRKRHAGGGLGLAITRELVELFDGKISVESELNQGTAFSVSLKLPLSEATVSPEPLDYKSLDFSHLNVLIVDDNKLNLIILRKILSEVKISPDLAHDGTEAISLSREKPYDLILMDVHMPELDGFKAVKEIRKNSDSREAIIFGISADVTQTTIEEGLKLGMQKFLTKPIEKTKLFTLLNIYFNQESEVNTADVVSGGPAI